MGHRWPTADAQPRLPEAERVALLLAENKAIHRAIGAPPQTEITESGITEITEITATGKVASALSVAETLGGRQVGEASDALHINHSLDAPAATAL